MADKKPETNVTVIKDFKKKKAKKEQGDRPPPKAQLYIELCSVINGEHEELPALPVKFHVLEPDAGVRQVLYELPNRTVAFCHRDMVVAAVTDWCKRTAPEKSEFHFWTVKTVRDAVEYWVMTQRPIPRPKGVAQLSDEALAFHRLEFNSCIPVPENEENEMPHWMELMSRTSNCDALQAFIGSLFFDNADRQQYIWMYGEGMNGKGSIIRFLHKLMGGSFASEDASQASNRFWSSGLVGKRLVVFPDCNSYSFPASQKFKALTGGDPVRIEKKGEGSYTTNLDCKFMFASNKTPALSGQQSDIRRAIFCEMGPIRCAPSPKYDAALWGEAAYILGKCIGIYHFMAGGGAMIPCETEELESVIFENEATYQTFFDDFLYIDFSEKKFDNQLKFITPQQLERLISVRSGKGAVDNRFKRSFLEWLRYKHGIKVSVTKIDGKSARVYYGIGVKSAAIGIANGRNLTGI